jgi:hypothetical protein
MKARAALTLNCFNGKRVENGAGLVSHLNGVFVASFAGSQSFCRKVARARSRFVPRSVQVVEIRPFCI